MNTTRRMLATGIGILGALGIITGCATASPAPPQGGQTPEATQTTAPATSAPTPTDDGDDPDDEGADPAAWTIDDGEFGPIEVGEPFAEALEESGWPATENCEWTASWRSPDDDYMAWFARSGDAPEGDVVEISIDAMPDAVTAPVGPRTEEGISLGSLAADVLDVYPDAQKGATMIGGQNFLKVASDDGATFFVIGADDRVSSITLTTADEPSYERCG